MIVIGVDPGKMTGWAACQADGTDFKSKEAPVNDFVDHMTVYLGLASPCHVAAERFVISGGTVTKGRTDENWTIEQIGVLRHLCRRHGHTFELQGAGDAKEFAPDSRLKQVGWHTPGRGHANDGARHLLLCLARRHQSAFEDLLTRSEPA